MKKTFRTQKAIAALTYLLDLSNGANDKYWLNKVMYYIERESILRYGDPIFFDNLYSMPLGPVVSEIKNGIDSADKNSDTETIWKKYILLDEDNDLHDVYEVCPGDYSILSESETELIEKAYEKFKGYSFREIMNYFYKNFPEYEDITGTPRRKPITYKNLLMKNGYSEEEASELIKEMAYTENNFEESYGQSAY